MSTRFRGICFAARLLVSAQAAFAQGVGPGGPSEVTYTLQGVGSLPEDSTQFQASGGSPGASIPVELDPAGPPWVKHFVLPSDYIAIAPGYSVRVTEWLTIGGQQAWTGWGDEILTPDFEWVVMTTTSVYVNGMPAPGLTRDFAPSGIPEGKGLLFSFDSLSPGTIVEISRKMIYTGSVPFEGQITIQSYPTPEPATALLLLAGAVAVRRTKSRLARQPVRRVDSAADSMAGSPGGPL